MLYKLYKHNYFLLFILFVFVFLNRLMEFGNPLVHIDEQFYLFGGGQILSGHLPYVQFWDRKPIGLFLLYAFFHLFGSYRVIAYQIGAALCVWATALLLFRMALTIAPRAGAMASAMLYVVWLNLAGGEGGQSPVFYNLLIAASVALVLFRSVLAVEKSFSIRTTGLLAMSLIGVALQIKYTVIFEGLGLGLYLIWASWQQGRNLPQIATDCFVWISAALMPTLLVAIFYYASGYGHEWFFANIVSIFLRGHLSPDYVFHLKLKLFKTAAPLSVGLLFTAIMIYRKKLNPAATFLFLWSLVSCSGVVCMGGWYYHYALPTYAPLAIMSAPLWCYTVGRILLAGLIGFGAFSGQTHLHRHIQEDGNLQTYNSMLSAMKNPDGCLFIYQGPPIFYDTSHWCGITDHPFPGHFNEKIERFSTGFDQEKGLEQVLLKKPYYIITKSPAWEGENLNNRAKLYDVLGRSYKKIYTFQGIHTDTEIFELN